MGERVCVCTKLDDGKGLEVRDLRRGRESSKGVLGFWVGVCWNLCCEL